MPHVRGMSTETPSTPSDLSDTKVAIYGGVGVLSSSRDALENMFLWMNASVDIVYAFEIINDTLDSYDIVVFPGGSAASYSLGLGTEGLDIVREFVRNGGSYFGICGGSLFATNAVLGLFDGSYSNSINGTDIYLTEMLVNQNSTGPDLSTEPESYWTMYWASAYFYGDMSNVIPICTYPSNDRPGMIALTYDEGTAFLSSPHPEYEEGDSRDGTSEYDYLNDPDTEWGLLLKVSRWLVDESVPAINQDGNPIIPYMILGTVALIGLVSVIYLIKKRMT
ncbi:MAG: BPL-N domain-containing protein [Candidatus Thorarchaeota archaeon]